MLGVLLGEVHKGTVDVSNSFAGKLCRGRGVHSHGSVHLSQRSSMPCSAI